MKKAFLLRYWWHMKVESVEAWNNDVKLVYANNYYEAVKKT